MKKAIYVDYENVNIGGLKGIEELTSDDLVKIFIGAQTSKLTMVDANRIFNCEATVELITNKYIGKNALDFIIMVHMGYDLAQGLAKSYYIISKDKGYDPAIHEMRRMSGLTIARKEAIAVIEEKNGFGKRIKGIFAFSKDKEAPDTTEHTVVGQGKKDDKAISKIKKEYVHENELKKDKKKNKKEYNKDRGIKGAKSTEKSDSGKPKSQNTSPKKKTVVKKQDSVKAVSEVKPVELKQSHAVAEVNNKSKKSEHIELQHETSEVIGKENRKIDKVELQTGTAIEAINNHPSNHHSYYGRGSGSRNNRGRNNRSNYSGNNNNAVSKTSENEYSEESVRNPQIESVEETENDSVTIPVSDYSGFNENRSSRRYNNRRNNRSNYRKNNNRSSGNSNFNNKNSKKSDFLSQESSAIMSAQPVEETNKPASNYNEPVHVETEYERQRREAFAILEELNRQD